MNKKVILSAVTLLTIATSSTIGIGPVLATKGNVKDTDACVYFALEGIERNLTSEKVREILEEKGFTLKTELTGDVGTGTEIEVEKDGLTYNYVVVLLGDTNGDGKLNTLDISRIRKYNIHAVTDATEYQELAMNVNNDEKVGIQDISKLRKMLIGREEPTVPEEQLPEEQLPEVDSLATKKQEAINTINENYPEGNYYAEDYTAVTDAITVINGENLDTVTDVQNYLDEITPILDEIQTKQEKFNAKVEAAKTELEELQAAYTSADYEVAELADIKNIIDTAIANLDELTIDTATLADVDAVVENAENDVAKIKTKLDLAKEKANSDLDSYISTEEINQANYSEENWETILELVTSGKTTIDEVTKATDTDTALRNVQIIKEDTITEIDAIPSISKALAELKTNKMAEINSTIPTADPDQEDEITNLKETAIVAIEGATTAEEVNEIANEALTALSAYRTEAQNTAIAKIDEDYVEEDYYSTDWAEMIVIINKAKSDIAKSADDEIATIVSQLNNDLATYKTIATQLTEAKANATIELNNTYASANYDSETWTEVSVELAAQTEIINSKITKTQVNIALENAKAVLDEFDTIAEKTATTKTAAIAALDAELNEYTESEYSEDNWATLAGYVTTAKETINAEGATIEVINTAKEGAIEAMAEVETIAQTELREAKTAAIAAIGTEYAKYNDIINDTDVYTTENAAVITGLNDGAEEEINALTTVAAVNAKKDEIIQDMKDVKKVQQESLETAISAEGNYKEADYYTDDWANITTIVNNAINTIKGSYVKNDIETVYDDAIAGIEEIQTKAQALASAKVAACAAIDTKARAYDGTATGADYIDTTLGELVTSLKAEINAAITQTKVAVAQETAIANLENYFANVQGNATSAIDDKVTELELDATTDELVAIITPAKAAIDNATTIVAVNTAKDDAIASIVAYATSVEETV